MWFSFTSSPKYKIDDLVEVEEYKHHKPVDPSVHPKNGIVRAVFNWQESPNFIGEKTYPDWRYVVKVEHPIYGMSLLGYEMNFVAWLLNDNPSLDTKEQIVIVKEFGLNPRVDKKKYPSTCPSCKRDAYVGVVPNSVKCSNMYCKHAERK